MTAQAMEPPAPAPAYGLTKHLPGVAFDEAVARVTDALKAEGFGVLTEIDVQETLKKKLGVDFPRYVILGACNPTLAHRALSADPYIGLLLPCNVIVMEARNATTVSIADPSAMFRIVDNAVVAPIADEAEATLKRALERL
jgi:uncharacterized protein (DUF302 family)